MSQEKGKVSCLDAICQSTDTQADSSQGNQISQNRDGLNSFGPGISKKAHVLSFKGQLRGTWMVTLGTCQSGARYDRVNFTTCIVGRQRYTWFSQKLCFVSRVWACVGRTKSLPMRPIITCLSCGQKVTHTGGLTHTRAMNLLEINCQNLSAAPLTVFSAWLSWR